MQQINQFNSYLSFLIILSLQINLIEAIFKSCQVNSDCVSNSFCGYKNYCICNDNYIVDCSIQATILSTIPVTTSITQSYSYFIVQPKDLFQYIKFSIKYSTTDTQTYSIISTFWGQTGYLQSLNANNMMEEIQFNINSTQTQSIETTYIEFGLQPNGQYQVVYIGVRINSTIPASTQLSISMEQFPAYNENVFTLVITILMAILSVACFVLFGFCIYRRRRMSQMRQRAEQQKQVKSTSHFDQYMPKVFADRVNVPLQVCSVCLNDIILEHQVRLTICKHLFHSQCIDSWCKKNNSCPICRQELDLQSCQKILGQEFDLSESLSIKKISDKHKNEVEMLERTAHKNDASYLHEVQIVEQNSMRRNML